MKLTGLTRRIAELEPVAVVRRGTGHTRVFGLLHAAKPAVAAALARETGPVLVLAAHPQAAHDLAEDLRHWSGRRVSYFPALEILPYERGRLDRSVLAAREAVLRDLARAEVDIIVAPVRAIMQPVPAPQGKELEPVTLAVGDQIRLDHLLARWVEGGYTDTAVVDEAGTFARRGGVIDVFPVGAELPVRIELFGNEIDSLRSFDAATQRSVASTQQVTVHPIAAMDEDVRLGALDALLAVDTAGMNAEAQSLWMDDLARLEAGASFDELAIFTPYLMPRSSSLIEHLPTGAAVILDTARESWTVVEDLWRQAGEVQQGREETGDLPRALKPALLAPENIRRSLEERRLIAWLTGSPDEDDAVDWSELFAPAHLYAGRLRAFAHDVANRPAERVVIASQQGERVAELLAEDDISARQISDLENEPAQGVTVLAGSLSEGWVMPTQHVTVLTDHELFGRARSRPIPRRVRPARETFFADFSPGDYVVHLEHGIGRFEGVTRMSFDGTEREYALVQYAGADRVYVPTDQLERLTRYIGVGEAAPQLNRLGGGEWQRARQRAKAAAAEIAGELIDLYSKRMARPGHGFSPDTPWQRELEASFAYPETPDQLRAVAEVKSDMEAAHPMDRLVCADVGYGKTEVAVRAAFKAIIDGRQVAVLAPTTILAQQHFETFSERFGAFPVNVEVLSRFRTPAQQREILRKAAAGEIDVLIGTHRLLQKDVSFKNLGLLIVDEEQRFGVRHKEQLKKLREAVDVLTLTATPIPRTLHMTLVGIREVSVIETPPEGRLPVKTYLQPFDERLVREAVLRELDRDGQVYIVHNKVATIQAMAERIRRLVPEARVVIAHGQMDEAQLEKVMLTFAHQEADVLVSSTIIENGLDIPNVNTILVNNAHLLGLTQLYQLRGRVGRSANQAYAYLLYPRDTQLSHDAMRRMEAVFEAQELGAGFTIAMKDLEIRGAGNLLGAQQSGHAAAVGFDLYTRMVAEAVERLRGTPVQEPPQVTIDLPLTMYLPAEYVGNEAERLMLYRRMAAVSTPEELQALADELRDRFGPLPAQVESLITSVRIKLRAIEARVTSVTLGPEYLVVKAEPTGVYDRVSLHRRYGMEARISTNVLRIPRRVLGPDWLEAVRTILDDMVRLRQSIAQPVGA